MKITNTNVPNTSLTQKPQIPPAPNANGSEKSGEIATSSTKPYAPSPELVRLIDLVRQQPEIRADRVREVADRLSQGIYFSRKSAEKTATAFLAAHD